MRAPNVSTISPASPFLETFVRSLLAGQVVPGFVPGFAPGADPLALCDVTIYVPTRRAARALVQAFADRAGGTSVVLPRILPLGALESTDVPTIVPEPGNDAAGIAMAPAASSVWRRLQLARLIQSWADAVSGAVRSVDANGAIIVDPSEAFRVATSTVDAFALAGDLAGLIDEMLIEDVDWRSLEAFDMAGFDEYWRITTTFLSIAFEQWPKVLQDHGFVDAARRQIALVDAQAKSVSTSTAEGPAARPVIAIGSTGTNKATARLLAAIARAPAGAVVLPGLDLDLDAAAWALIGGTLAPGQEPSFGHPQAAMARLLPLLGIARASVRQLGAPGGVAAGRARFVAEALRPADTTDLWRGWRKSVPEPALRESLAGVSLIEASDEREEALCLAIAMREVLETPGRTAALVTPDRDLARRVRGDLLRWSIEVDDSAGEPLARRPLGILARLVAAAAGGGVRHLSALLAHPLACFGQPRADVARLAALIEIAVLRVVPVSGTAEDIVARAKAAAADRHAHPAQRAFGAADWAAMALLWHALDAALAPLRALDGAATLDRWVDAHRACLAAVAGNADPGEATALAALFDALTPDGAALLFDAEGYGIFFGRLAGESALHDAESPHPRLAIYGLLEARLMTADVVLLAGLDETVWPPQAKTDPFLNRPMRQELGLSAPERRIGQTAHDFTQAMGNPTVILSRAAKRGGSPCVPSRFLLRMAALGGPAWAACRERGARFRDLARLVDSSPITAVPVARPRPTPPVALRPERLSVTQIETLRRDPYAVFAAHILELAPLPLLGEDLDAGTFGNLMHEALHAFSLHPDAAGSTGERRAAIRATVRHAFASVIEDPMFQAFRWPVIEKTMALFLAYDARQRETAARIVTEETGKLDISLADGSVFRLTARADRLDRHRDGSATLIDYKTGQPPGNTEIQVGFAPQLTLEAAMLRHGGFGPPHDGAIAATYLKLGGKDGGAVRPVTFKDEAFATVVDRHFAGLQQLLSAFRVQKTAYPSRPFPKFAKSHGPYDHLARVREWSLAADDESQP